MTGKVLQKRREAAGLSRVALAALAGVTSRTILRWEQGETEIPKLEALGLRTLFEDLERGRQT